MNNGFKTLMLIPKYKIFHEKIMFWAILVELICLII